MDGKSNRSSSKNGRNGERKRLEHARDRDIPALDAKAPIEFDVTGIEAEVEQEGLWLTLPTPHSIFTAISSFRDVPLSDPIPLDDDLHAEYLGRSGHLFRSRTDQIVLNIHCRGTRNLGTDVATSLFSQAIHHARKLGIQTLIVIHGHNHGNAWKHLVYSRFGHGCCEVFRGDKGKTLVRLPSAH